MRQILKIGKTITLRQRPFGIRSRLLAAVLIAGMSGCATLPPGAGVPKPVTTALAHPEETRLGRQFMTAAREHAGNSAFHIINAGVDGFVTRIQIVRAAERTLDLQYYIFRGDATGRMLTDELIKAADRGVRVRVLVDDGDTVAGDEQIIELSGHPNIETRVFNPFDYRGHNELLRHLDFATHVSRLDYRMHNKLLVVDNSAALIGGRNIGNQYFQLDPESQFADDDVFAAGPIAVQLSATFDEYWNSQLAIPAAALTRHTNRTPSAAVQPVTGSGIDYVARAASGEPYAGMISGKTPLTWAHCQLVYDSPDKKDVATGKRRGRLMSVPVSDAIRSVQSELLMVTPYFIPADGELALLKDLRQRQVRVRILSNSLESAPEPAAHAGYRNHRVPLLRDGVELYEARALLGSPRGSGQTAKVSRYGNYALHAKLYVFDRERFFIGSMNFDQRSLRINTEIGLLIDSPALAQQVAERFQAMVSPAAAYTLKLRPSGTRQRLVWDTEFDHKPVELEDEPAHSWWQRHKVQLLSVLPLDSEL